MLATVLRLAPLLVTIAVAASSARAQSPYAQSAEARNPVLLGKYPDHGTPNWGDNKTPTQGLAHDSDHWFISTTDTGRDLISDALSIKTGSDWVIWRIPVSAPLDHDFAADPIGDTHSVRRANIPPLDAIGATHPGDLDLYVYGGRSFLVVPMHSEVGPIIAIFDPRSLGYLDHAVVPGQRDIGWCAVSPLGALVTSNDETDRINGYSVDWGRLAREGKLVLGAGTSHVLHDQFSAGALTLYNMQGGEFSDDGRYLYLSTGVAKTKKPTDGLHVVDTETWTRVNRSCNLQRGIGCPFAYSFDSGGTGPDEPEGLTVWDLDDGRAPGVSGQLHVLLFNWHGFSFESHEVTVYHYALVAPGTPKSKIHQRRFDD